MNLIVTLGDPLSINVECILRILNDFSFDKNIRLTIIGSLYHFQYQANKLGFNFRPDHFIDIGHKSLEFPTHQLSLEQRGELATKALYKACEFSNPKAIITSPVNKFAMDSYGFGFPGHTEFFSHQEKVETLMMLTSKKIIVALCTNHVAINAIKISKELIVKKVQLFHLGLTQLLALKNPRIAVCGLNPHCGDNGLFGNEEREIISPSINLLVKQGIKAIGPVSADTVFYDTLQGNYDAVLAMFHDQGLPVVKALAFNECVNITVNLPYLRISPDHGPAEDMFLLNKASLGSFQTCFEYARSYLITKTV